MTIAAVPQQRDGDDVETIHDAAERLALLWARSYASADGRVSPSQLRALLVVERLEPMTLTALAAQLGAMVSSVSRLCDRLVAAGYLVREVNPRSRREVLVALTAPGARLLEEMRAHRITELRTLLRGLTEAERDVLLQGLTALQRVDEARSLPGV